MPANLVQCSVETDECYLIRGSMPPRAGHLGDYELVSATMSHPEPDEGRFQALLHGSNASYYRHILLLTFLSIENRAHRSAPKPYSATTAFRNAEVEPIECLFIAPFLQRVYIP